MTRRVKTKMVDKAGGVKKVYSQLDRKFEEQETQRRAANMHLSYFDLIGFPIDQSVLGMIPKDMAEAAQALCFAKEGPRLRIGAVDPRHPEVLAIVKDLEKQRYQPEIYLVSQSGFAESLKQYKKIILAVPTRQEVSVNTSPEALTQLKNLSGQEAVLKKTSATDLISFMIGSAVTMNASDIHLEPEKEFLKLRFRVDGVLQDLATLPLTVLKLLVSRIKLLSGLKLNVTTAPQDGRFTVHSGEQNLDLRVSVLPSAFGESVVIRILGQQEVSLNLEKLGLHERALNILLKELRKPNGMTLTTGPTGSGKTTTLYAFLNDLNETDVKIITLEDPVEYRLEGIVQTPIDHKAGMDFAKGLRSILRQDPDIIMVGEIRDFETAETACQAALTGHVVLSTLHTNDAAGAIPRLLDLGVKPVTLAPALNALIAQRLLRRICVHCKEVYKPNAKELERVKIILSQIPVARDLNTPEYLTFYHGKGCDQCHHIGYKGRVGVFEVFSVDDKIEKLIYQQASTLDIKQAAVDAGMLTMQQDGILKALAGETDLAEVWRVTEE